MAADITSIAWSKRPPNDVAGLGRNFCGPQVSVTLPALLEGTIEQPAQVQRVKFAVKANDRIAVEVETLRQTVPQFNPYLRIVSVTGDEAFTNVHSTVNTCGDTILKQIQPKTTYSFPRAGEFILEIRDITHTYAGPDFAYRVFLRHQVPHVGEVRAAEEQINLVAGEVAKIGVQTDQEEGFDGQIVLNVEGLPEGVRAMMGTDVQPQVPPPYNPGKVERFQPESQKATFLFLTDQTAHATPRPVEARIVAQPVVKGKLGSPLMVKKILVTISAGTWLMHGIVDWFVRKSGISRCQHIPANRHAKLVQRAVVNSHLSAFNGCNSRCHNTLHAGQEYSSAVSDSSAFGSWLDNCRVWVHGRHLPISLCGPRAHETADRVGPHCSTHATSSSPRSWISRKKLPSTDFGLESGRVRAHAGGESKAVQIEPKTDVL